ncbi:MAG: hypothetical protein K2Y25_16015 [Pseudomonadaceae bacterium]|nr:hypothetical protein [Pseudomonadaceae bacterium]
MSLIKKPIGRLNWETSTMQSLFRGPFFDYLMSIEPLCTAEYFTHGSSAMLFQRNGQLFRLTRDGSGHNFLAAESAAGNPNVVRIIHDFGPVAPSDEDYFGDEFYWLAEVEWLEDLDLSLPVVQELKNLLHTLTDDEPVQQQGIPDFISRCNVALAQVPSFAPLINTLLKAAEEVRSGGCDIDANISNVMQRPSSGLLVWSDPLFGTYGYLDDQGEARMVDVRKMIKSTEIAHAE